MKKTQPSTRVIGAMFVASAVGTAVFGTIVGVMMAAQAVRNVFSKENND